MDNKFSFYSYWRTFRFFFRLWTGPICLDRRSGRFTDSLVLRSNPPIDRPIDSNIDIVVARPQGHSATATAVELRWRVGVVDPGVNGLFNDVGVYSRSIEAC